MSFLITPSLACEPLRPLRAKGRLGVGGWWGWQGGCRSGRDRQGVRIGDLWTKPPVMVVSFLGAWMPYPADHCEESLWCCGRGQRGWGDREEQDRQAGQWEGGFSSDEDRDPQLRLLTPTPDPVTLAARGSQDARGRDRIFHVGMPPSVQLSGSLGWCPVSAH